VHSQIVRLARREYMGQLTYLVPYREALLHCDVFRSRGWRADAGFPRMVNRDQRGK
jgi:hypothetical protein